MSYIAMIVLGSSIAAIIGIAFGAGYGQSHQQRSGSTVAAAGVGTFGDAHLVYRFGDDRIAGYLLFGYHLNPAISFQKDDVCL